MSFFPCQGKGALCSSLDMLFEYLVEFKGDALGVAK
jgi:hypothetical protein